MNGSFKVHSPHYFGKPALKPDFVSQASSELVTPESNIVGRTFKAPTVGSYGHADPILAQTFDACGYPIWENRTSNNTFRSYDVPTNGYFSSQIDDGVIRGDYQFSPIADWKAVGEQSQMREEVRIPQKSVNYGLIESFGERQLKLTEGDTPVDLFVHDFSYSGPINSFGRFSHQVRNLKQNLMDYYGMKSTHEFVSFLKSRGLTLKEIDYLAAGFIPEGFAYAVNKVNGKRILFASEDAYEGDARTARAFGLNPKDIREFGFDEEQIHLARDNYTSSLAEIIAEEIATKSIARDFYIKMARNSQGNPELARKYAMLAALKEEDIRTTRRVYTAIHKKHRADLEERVNESEQHAATADGEYTAQNGIASNVVSMPKYKSKGKETDEKGKVLYGKFGKDYRGRTAEAEQTAETDAKSDRDAPDSKDSGEVKGETNRGEAQAEAA